jgi:hypothetical protein
MPSSPAERDEYCEYFCGSGALTCRVLYRTEQLAFVQFRTVDWPGYKDFGNYARVALFHEHLRPADPQSPGVMNFVRELERETAAQQQQHASGCKHQANGQRASDKGIHISKPNGQGGSLPAAAKSAEKPSNRGITSAQREPSKIKLNGQEVSSRHPARVRAIENLALRDFGF